MTGPIERTWSSWWTGVEEQPDSKYKQNERDHYWLQDDTSQSHMSAQWQHRAGSGGSTEFRHSHLAWLQRTVVLVKRAQQCLFFLCRMRGSYLSFHSNHFLKEDNRKHPGKLYLCLVRLLHYFRLEDPGEIGEDTGEDHQEFSSFHSGAWTRTLPDTGKKYNQVLLSSAPRSIIPAGLWQEVPQPEE